jgi:hypothetical protein
MSRDPLSLEKLISGLAGDDRAALLDRYRQIYGAEAPKRISRSLLVAAIAYRLQVQAYGGIKPSVRQALVSGSPRRRAPGSGTVLIREWHGQHHTVNVRSDGVEYRGQRFRSLSEVARLITGQRRSGPAFFGLKDAARA